MPSTSQPQVRRAGWPQPLAVVDLGCSERVGAQRRAGPAPAPAP